VEKTSLNETTPKQAVQKTNREINRYMIMEKVNACANWLANKALQKHCVGNNKVKAMRGAIYGYSVVLRALTDEKLTVELTQNEPFVVKMWRPEFAESKATE
jgi:hypothetical protein